MSEANFSAHGVVQALRAEAPQSAGSGRCVMVIAARRGEGVSTAARAVADAAGPGTVYAIDLDLRRNAMARSYSIDTMLGPRIDGKLSGASFFRITDAEGRPLPEPHGAYSYHRIGRSRLHVGAFDVNVAPENSRLLISNEPDYWRAARAGGATVVVDAPALERSAIGLRIAKHMDGVVLVVRADAGAAPAAMAARTEILAAGGYLLGLVYTNASAPAVAIDRLFSQAG